MERRSEGGVASEGGNQVGMVEHNPHGHIADDSLASMESDLVLPQKSLSGSVGRRP
jgi:hypothetical protein